MPPHHLANFEAYKNYQNKPWFNNDVYSTNNLAKLRDGAYAINPKDYDSIGTHWIDAYVNDDGTYFDSFGSEHIPKEIKKLFNNRIITTNIFRMHAYNSIICRYFCIIGFIDLILKGKSLLGYENLFCPKKCEKNFKSILKYFQQIIKMLKLTKHSAFFVVNIENIKTRKYHIFLKNHLFFLL